MCPSDHFIPRVTYMTPVFPPGAIILFPDAEDRNIPQQKKSSVVICGSVRAVYRARQMLIVSTGEGGGGECKRLVA